MSCIGSIANSPKRPGESRGRPAIHSLLSRAMRRAASGSAKLTAGVVTDTMDVDTPALSMSSRVFATDQLVMSGVARFLEARSATYLGGET